MNSARREAISRSNISLKEEARSGQPIEKDTQPTGRALAHAQLEHAVVPLGESHGADRAKRSDFLRRFRSLQSFGNAFRRGRQNAKLPQIDAASSRSSAPGPEGAGRARESQNKGSSCFPVAMGLAAFLFLMILYGGLSEIASHASESPLMQQFEATAGAAIAGCALYGCLPRTYDLPALCSAERDAKGKLRFETCAAIILSAGFGVIVGVVLSGFPSGTAALSTVPTDQSVPTAVVVAVLLAVTTSLFEEIAFRGVLFNALLEQSLATALVGSAFIFAICHIPPVDFIGVIQSGDISSACAIGLKFASTFLFGIATACMVRVTGTLTVAVMVHALYDAALNIPFALNGCVVFRWVPQGFAAGGFLYELVYSVALAALFLVALRRVSLHV